MKNKLPIEQRILDELTELKGLVRDIREFLPRQTPTRTLEPQLADINWVMEYLDIRKSAFYKNVWRKELTPVRKIGRREYYDKEEVYALMRRRGAA